MKKEALQEIKCRINDLIEEGTQFSVSIIGHSCTRFCCLGILNIDDVLDGISNYLKVNTKETYGIDEVYIDLDSVESVTLHVRR